MTELDALHLHANAWAFLAAPQQYVNASGASGRTLLPEATRRQFLTVESILQRLNGSQGERARRGILLADDVGFGKTTVAALVAWVVAGKDASVRILAPNKVMQRRWAEELEYHIAPLQVCAPHLDASESRIRTGDVQRLRRGSIHVATHRYAAKDGYVGCDLLIVDEAHRAKGDDTDFARALRDQGSRAKRVLFLTATPMSITLDDLTRVLMLIGAEDVLEPVRAYSKALRQFYRADRGVVIDDWVERLSSTASAAVSALSPYVIRHALSPKRAERERFGSVESWDLPVSAATDDDLELLMRVDRMLRLQEREKDDNGRVFNDARFHVGYRQLDRALDDIEVKRETTSDSGAVIDSHLKRVRKLREQRLAHPKVDAVAAAAVRIAGTGEKVLVFCHHHASAQEVALAIRQMMPGRPSTERAGERTWHEAWNRALVCEARDACDDHEKLREVMVRWLAQAPLRSQVQAWIPEQVSLRRPGALLAGLQQCPIPGDHTTTIAEAASRLFTRLVERKSESTIGVLRAASRTQEVSLLQHNDAEDVLAICEAPDDRSEREGFLDQQEPDTAIAIFNSAFGARVLVTTDALSEGVDLHRHCRHLIHFELSPSPIRTIQRNGRLRRVNAWAATVNEPLRVAYPAFRGTRDERLVNIMKQRLDAFSMLLGGAPKIDLADIDDRDERDRSEVLERVRASLEKLNNSLAVAK